VVRDLLMQMVTAFATTMMGCDLAEDSVPAMAKALDAREVEDWAEDRD
jgi:hypothetical protein